jgi:hypothetical protein
MLPSCLIKHANLNKTTAAHAADSTNKIIMANLKKKTLVNYTCKM